jgi:hypothetical protein
MISAGAISDFDRAGLFGLVMADDGRLLLFNLRRTPPPLRGRFEVGTRVRITEDASEPAARAVELAPIDEWSDGRSSSASAASDSVSCPTAMGKRRPL